MNYSIYSDKAKEKITQYGSACEIHRLIEGGTYNEDTDSYEGEEKIIKGVALLSGCGLQNVNGSTILAGDVFIMCVLDDVPHNDDSIIIGDNQYSIVNVETVSPNGKEVIYYKLQGRK